MCVCVRYRLTGLPVDYQTKNISSPDVTNLLLEDLIIWTNYEIEVAAYNGAGLGTYSHKVTEWTLQGGEGSTGFVFASRQQSVVFFDYQRLYLVLQTSIIILVPWLV